MANIAMRASVPMPSRVRPPGDVQVRPLRQGDAADLGRLMHAACAGGVEDVGQDEAWHAQEVLGGAYGRVLNAASTWVYKGGDALAATVVTDWQEEGETLLAFALVHPTVRGQCLGSWCITRSARILADMQVRDWVLAVEATSPARRLYRRLGFEQFNPKVSGPDNKR